MYHEENAVRIEKKKSKSKFPFFLYAPPDMVKDSRAIPNCGMIDPTFSLRTEWFVFFFKNQKKIE
jgi:hypothetical protein